MTDTPRRRTLSLVAIYAALGAGWGVVAAWAVPPVIAAAYEGRSLTRLNRFFLHRAAPHPLAHYLTLWHWFAWAVVLAGCAHLALVLIARPRRALGLFAGAFLAATVLSGPRHDYTAYLEIWDAILRGHDPWWVHEVWGYPLNAYGPLFNALAIPYAINPLAPKILFATAYLIFALRLLPRSGRLGRFALVANPYPWVEIALFGHYDVLIGLACVAAVDASRRGREGWAGAFLAVGVLLKYLPIVLVPFFVVQGRRFRPRPLLAFAVTTAAGMGLGLLVWGPSTLRPLVQLASPRPSDLLSIFRYLRGALSPLRLLWDAPDLDAIASPCLLIALGSAVAWCQLRRTDVARSSVLAVLTTLLLYRVGFPQYWMVLFLIGNALAPEVALHVYLGWLGLFDVFYAAIDGIIRPGGRWAWVEDVAGLPTFLLGLVFLTRLLRPDRLR